MLRDQTNCIRIFSHCCYYIPNVHLIYKIFVVTRFLWIFFFRVCLFRETVSSIPSNEITRDNIWGVTDPMLVRLNRIGTEKKNETETIFHVVKIYFTNKRKRRKTDTFKKKLHIACPISEWTAVYRHWIYVTGTDSYPFDLWKKIIIPSSLMTHKNNCTISWLLDRNWSSSVVLLESQKKLHLKRYIDQAIYHLTNDNQFDDFDVFAKFHSLQRCKTFFSCGKINFNHNCLISQYSARFLATIKN